MAKRRKKNGVKQSGIAGSFRVLVDTDRLSASERKKIFARNFDHLIRIVGLRRNEAAEQIGIPYEFVRRLATAGISRLDPRSAANIQKIVDFFVLRAADELWQHDLLSWLLNPEYDSKFIERFRDMLHKTLHSAKPSKIDQERLSLISGALGLEPPQAVRWMKVKAILSSSKANQFASLIDDYYELISEKPVKVA